MAASQRSFIGDQAADSSSAGSEVAVCAGKPGAFSKCTLSKRPLNALGFVIAYKILPVYFSTINSLVNSKFQSFTAILFLISIDPGSTVQSRASIFTPFSEASLSVSPKAGCVVSFGERNFTSFI